MVDSTMPPSIGWEGDMETPYDWVTVAIFAGLVVLFMQRSTSDDVHDEHDSIWLYLGAGLGCAVSNYIRKPTRPEWIAHRDFTPIEPCADDALEAYARSYRQAAE